MRHRVLVGLVGLLLGASVVSADTLSPFNTDTSRNTWTTAGLYDMHAVVHTHQATFWNNDSRDVGDCNVGYWVSGASNCHVANFYDQSPGGTPAYVGTGQLTFGFQPNAQEVDVTVGVQVARWATIPGDNGQLNEFGWFPLANPDNRTPILGGASGAVGAGSAFTFVPTGPYGFYILSPEGLFTSNTLDGDGKSHFAVFEVDPRGHFIIGMEDNIIGGGAGGSDWDYNDMILEVNGVDVPEPASIMLLGAGLFGLAFALKRRGLK